MRSLGWEVVEGRLKGSHEQRRGQCLSYSVTKRLIQQPLRAQMLAALGLSSYSHIHVRGTNEQSWQSSVYRAGNITGCSQLWIREGFLDRGDAPLDLQKGRVYLGELSFFKKKFEECKIRVFEVFEQYFHRLEIVNTEERLGSLNPSEDHGT